MDVRSFPCIYLNHRLLICIPPFCFDFLVIVFSPCGRYVAAGSVDGTMVIWCVDTGVVSKVLNCHSTGDKSGSEQRVVDSDSTCSVTAVFWSGNSRIFVANKRGNVLIWS